MSTYVHEPWKYPDAPLFDRWDAIDYDLDYEKDSDGGGRGLYDSRPSDNKCILDEGIATFLASLGYVVPTTRKTAAFFLLCISDEAIQDLPFKERVVLVYENFCFGDDDECCGYGW